MVVKALLVLAAGAFVSQTTEYLPVGLLNQIAVQLNLSDATTGILITVYAWVITLSVLPVTLLTRRLDRKHLFICLLGLIALCNGAVLFTERFEILILLRVIAALGHGVFWASIASYAINIAGRMSASRATAIVFSGISLSIVMGVPVSTALGHHFGWQKGFAVFGLLALLVMVCAVKWLPSLRESKQKTAEQDGGKSPLSGALCLLTAVTLFIVTAHFSSYTYITIFLQSIPGVNAGTLSVLLFIFGVGGACGTLFISRFPCGSQLLTLAGGGLIVLTQTLFLLKLPGPVSAGGVLFLWGCAVSVVIVGLQTRVIEASRGHHAFASALYVMAFNTGIGSGAMAGGLLTGFHDSRGLFIFSAAVCLAGVLLAAVISTGHSGNRSGQPSNSTKQGVSGLSDRQM